jgi:hypothetical protein
MGRYREGQGRDTHTWDPTNYKWNLTIFRHILEIRSLCRYSWYFCKKFTFTHWKSFSGKRVNFKCKPLASCARYQDFLTELSSLVPISCFFSVTTQVFQFWLLPSTCLKTSTGHQPWFTIAHASNENDFSWMQNLCLKNINSVHNEMDGDSSWICLAENLLPQSVIVVANASSIDSILYCGLWCTSFEGHLVSTITSMYHDHCHKKCVLF